MDTVEALWQQIETWLSIHAPHAWHMLRPGASQWEIQEAEVALGITLPEHFKASCRIHDGGYIIDLVTEMNIFSLKDIVAEWQMFQELEEVGTWSDAGIPYYFTEYDHCCLDLIPAPGGSMGQVIDRDHEAGPSRVLAASFLEVLSTFASDLEAGTYVDTDIGLRG